MSPAWPHRKHLSTLPEESDGLTSHLSDEEDDAPQPDVYVQAVLMPVENLGRPVRGGGMVSLKFGLCLSWSRAYTAFPNSELEFSGPIKSLATVDAPVPSRCLNIHLASRWSSTNSRPSAHWVVGRRCQDTSQCRHLTDFKHSTIRRFPAQRRRPRALVTIP